MAYALLALVALSYAAWGFPAAFAVYCVARGPKPLRLYAVLVGIGSYLAVGALLLALSVGSAEALASGVFRVAAEFVDAYCHVLVLPFLLVVPLGVWHVLRRQSAAACEA